MDEQQRKSRPADPHRSPSSGTPRIPIESLLGDAREAIIVHNGEDYRLRITSNGKLILTK